MMQVTIPLVVASVLKLESKELFQQILVGKVTPNLETQGCLRSRDCPRKPCGLLERSSQDKDKGNSVARDHGRDVSRGTLGPGKRLSFSGAAREDFLQERGDGGRGPRQRGAREQAHGSGRSGRWTHVLPGIPATLMLQEAVALHVTVGKISSTLVIWAQAKSGVVKAKWGSTRTRAKARSPCTQ